MENGKLHYQTSLDNSQLRADAENSKSILQNIGQTATQEGARMESAMKNVGAAMAGVFAVGQLKDFATKVATVRGEFQQLEIAFNTMLGSKQQADALMQQLINTAATTPFGMNDIANSAKQLLAYGVEAGKVNDTLVRLGDIAAGLSIPINDLAYLYGTTMVQGRLYTQDLNQFLGRGIPLTKELAGQFGVAESEVKKLVEQGKIGFPEVEKAIISMTSEGSQFGGLMAAQSKSITGQIANLEDAIEQMINEIGKSSEGAISGSISLASSLVENWRSVGEAIMAVVAVVGAYKAAIISAAAVQGAMKSVQHTEEAAQLFQLLNAEQQARISKMGLAQSSEAYYVAVKAEIEAEMERQTQLAVTTNAELAAARERLAAAEQQKVAAAEAVATKRAELEATLQEAGAEQAAAVQKKIAREAELQSRAALRAHRLSEQRDALIAQAQALKEQGASAAKVQAKQREIAAISQKMAVARAEEIQRGRNIIALRAEMNAEVTATNSKKVAKAITALETAEENLNTAAKARNTAARNVSSKAAALDSTIRRANTIETGVNTAAETANAGASNLLAAAKTRLIAISAKLNAVIMANPYALAAAAVVALGYAIYKLVTYESDAEKQQKALNKAVGEANQSISSETTKLEALYGELKKAKKGTEAYRKAKDAITSQYGNYLKQLSDERGKVIDVAEAYELLRDKITQAAKARAMQAYIDKQTKENGDARSDLVETLREQMSGLFHGANLDRQVDRILGKIGKDDNQVNADLNRWFQKVEVREIRDFEGNVIREQKLVVNRVLETVNKIRALNKKEQDSVRDASRAFGLSVSDMVNANSGSSQGNSSKPKVKNKAYYEQLKKEKEDELASLEHTKANENRRAQLIKEIAQIDKKIKWYDTKSNGKTGPDPKKEAERIAAETFQRKQLIKQYNDGLSEEAVKGAQDLRQKEIDAMADGFDKELAQLTLNYARLRAENRKRRDEMLKDLADKKVNEWLNQHPKATKQQETTYRNSLLDKNSPTRLTEADLSINQQELLKGFEEQNDLFIEQGKTKLYEKLLEKYRDYEAQRVEINRKYDEERRGIESGGGDNTEKERAIAVLEEKRKSSLQAVYNEEAEQAQKSSTLLISLFEDAGEKSSAQIRKIVDETQALLEYLKQTEGKDITPKFGFTSAELLAMKESPERLQKIIQQLEKLKKAAEQANPFRTLAKAFKDLFKNAKEGGAIESLEAKLKKVGKATSGAADTLIPFAGNLKKVFEAAGNEDMASVAGGVQQALQAASNIGQGFAKGGIIGGIGAAAGEMMNVIAGAFEAEARHKKALQAILKETTAQQRAFTLALLEEELQAKKMSTVFGTLDYKKAVSAVDVLHKSYQELGKELRKINEIQVKTGHRKTGFLGWGAGEDVFSSILATYPKLINAQGEFDEKLAQTILDTRELKEEHKSLLQQLIKLKETAVKAQEEVKNYLTNIFGDLGNQLSDALVDAFKNGTNAAEKFTGSLSNMLEKFTTQMIFDTIFGDDFQRATEEIMKIRTDKTLTEEQKLKRMTEYLDGLNSSLAFQQEAFNKAIEKQKENAKKHGFDLYEAEKGARQASEKGIASASQDSVNELNGRMTAVQGHTFSISENTRLLTANSSAILRSVMGIERNTNDLPERLAAVESGVRAVKDSLNDIALKGIKIKN